MSSVATGTSAARQAVPDPIGYSLTLGREIRQDGIDTLGISTQTWCEQAVQAGAWRTAEHLLTYFSAEMTIIGRALFTWAEDIIGYRLDRERSNGSSELAAWLLRGIREFDPSSGDRIRAVSALRDHDEEAALAAAELMRVRYASLHDTCVAWIQELLAGLATDFGEESVLEAIERAYECLWKPRYATWNTMSAQERLQLSVEGMRGHLSGMSRRGDVGIIEESDRYVMVLDPCGSCGVLRRGDPESGRAPHEPAGNQRPHPWTWGRSGVGWYAVHSPIVMEYVWMRDGRPPMRPLADCDRDRPCRWFVYKDPNAVRAEHYERMGFRPPA